MKFDSLGFLNMQQTDYPGSIGDAARETFGYFHLARTLCVLAGDFNPEESVQLLIARLYERIRTEKGYLRHPNAPEGWREDDFSGDQTIALLICLESWGLLGPAEELIGRTSWRYGNGDLIHPTYIAAKCRVGHKPSLFWDFFIYAQALAMKHLSYRWNDETKRLEKSLDSSADFINFLHLILQAERVGHTYFSRKAQNVFTADEIRTKIYAYYSPEPISAWILDLYDKAIEQVFRG